MPKADRIAALVRASTWYEIQVADGVDLARPGIYLWEIEDVGSYIGKYTHATRPLIEYQRNVMKIESGRPYRPQKPTAFRRIHRALAEAKAAGRRVRLTILENCEACDLTSREAELIPLHGTLNGRSAERQRATAPPQVLTSDA